MSLFERKFELGVMKAIGTKPSQLFQIVFFETVLLGVLGTILGAFLASIIIFFLRVEGISFFQGVEYSGVNLNQAIFPQFRWYQFTILPCASIFISFLASLYPSFLASKINIKEAFSKNL